MSGSTGMLMLKLLPMLALLVWAAVEDLRIRKIRNWLTFSLALGGICCSAVYAPLVTPGRMKARALSPADWTSPCPLGGRVKPGHDGGGVGRVSFVVRKRASSKGLEPFMF